MPVHRIPTAEGQIETAYEAIEKANEVIAVVSDGPGAAIVFTKPKARRAAGEKETRG